MKYEVYENSMSEEIVFATNSLAALLKFGENNGTRADAVTVNGLVAYGWDEIESKMLENM